MKSTNKCVRDLNPPTDFWGSRVGDFVCWDNNLDSLDGCPDKILGDFVCWENNLTSLADGPKTVGGSFNCTNNHLTSLEHAPTDVGGYFDCSENHLTSLEHAPTDVGGYFDCSENQLTSLAGCPKIMGGYCYFANNRLTSLADIHTHVQQMNGDLSIGGNPIVSHILGILLIRGCRTVSDYSLDTSSNKKLKQAITILNKYLRKGRACIMECQAEMLAAGLDDFAQI